MALAFSLLAAACGGDGGSAGSPFAPGNNQPVDASDILGDLENGNVELEDLLESTQESAQERAEGLFVSGSGTVEINGDTINFTSEACYVGRGGPSIRGDFSVEGPGSTGDGTPVWVSISRNVTSRAELAEFLDEDTLQNRFGDADQTIESSLQLSYGKTEIFGSAPFDMPTFNADSSYLDRAEIEFEVNGNEARGSGRAVDVNLVAGDFEATFDFTFQANCS